jgi:hypothetical protein
MKKTIKLGDKFNRLTIIEFSHKNNAYQNYYKCLCDCGNSKTVRLDHLKSGKIASCGCISIENPPAKTHGMRNSKIYSIWCDMKKRCYNPATQNYKYYGGKGITVCERWMSFENFLEDMGELPTQTSSIERLEIEKGYYKENCKWIELNEQAANRSNTICIQRNGISYSLRRIAEKLKIDYGKVYRLYKNNSLSSLKWEG